MQTLAITEHGGIAISYSDKLLNLAASISRKRRNEEEEIKDLLDKEHPETKKIVMREHGVTPTAQNKGGTPQRYPQKTFVTPINKGGKSWGQRPWLQPITKPWNATWQADRFKKPWQKWPPTNNYRASWKKPDTENDKKPEQEKSEGPAAKTR